jgi:hypothetical protein
MNWRKNWRKAFCTLLIVTAEAHRVYDATHPRTRKPGPGFAGQDEQLLVSKTKCLQPNFNTKVDSADFRRSVFPLSSAPRRAQERGKPSRSLTLK